MEFYVYEMWDPIKNEPFYVGKGMVRLHTKSGKNERYLFHIKQAKGLISTKNKNAHNINRIKKILSWGVEPVVKIVFNTDKEVEAFSKEKELIKKYGRRDLKTGCLTNHTEGGDGVSGRIFTKEEKDRISKRVSGSGNYMFGKTHTPEVKKIISEARKKYPTYYHTKEWKEYLKSEDSELIKANIKRKKEIYQISVNGNVIKKWSSISLAAKELGISKGNIFESLRKPHCVCGYYWRYTEEVNIIDNKLQNINILNEQRLKSKNGKEVYQFDLKGNFIKKWDSVLQIEKTLNIKRYFLYGILNKKSKINIYNNFVWSLSCANLCRS